MASPLESNWISSFPVLQGALPIGIAHRGGAWEAPENSERAFRHSVDLGFSFIETDVRATKDGVPVVFHDASLDRTTDGSGLIRTKTWDELAEAKIHGREPIMRLDEMLRKFPSTRFNIDVKEENAVAPFLDVIRETGTWARICVGSFDHQRLSLLRRLAGSRLASSLSPREVLALRMSASGIPFRWTRPKAACVQVPVAMGGVNFAEPGFIQAAHSFGWQVHVWTIDDEKTMSRLIDIGVDGIMTDRPSRLRTVLGSFGLWPDQ